MSVTTKDRFGRPLVLSDASWDKNNPLDIPGGYRVKTKTGIVHRFATEEMADAYALEEWGDKTLGRVPDPYTFPDVVYPTLEERQKYHIHPHQGDDPVSIPLGDVDPAKPESPPAGASTAPTGLSQSPIRSSTFSAPLVPYKVPKYSPMAPMSFDYLPSGGGGAFGGQPAARVQSQTPGFGTPTATTNKYGKKATTPFLSSTMARPAPYTYTPFGQSGTGYRPYKYF